MSVEAWLDLVVKVLDKVTGDGKRKEEEAARIKEEKFKKKLFDNGVSCRECGEVALPVVGTGTNYRCQKCGNQFRGGRHDL